MPHNALTLAAACAVLLTACGGGDDLPPPGTPAGQPQAPTTQPAAPAQQQPTGAVPAQQSTGAQAAPADDQTGLQRETFAYTGAGRDPFLSLIRTGAVRPRLEDLRVTGITYDSRYPGNSVAVLRDTTVNQRYTVRVGDELGRGRIRIAAIQPSEVTVIVEQLGVERQEVLRLRRRQQEEE